MVTIPRAHQAYSHRLTECGVTSVTSVTSATPVKSVISLHLLHPLHRLTEFGVPDDRTSNGELPLHSAGEGACVAARLVAQADFVADALRLRGDVTARDALE